MSVNVTDMFKDFIRTLLNDRETAAQFAGDPDGVMAAQGVTEHDLSRVDVPGAVREVCADPSTAQGTRQALQSYSNGSAGPAQSHGPQTMEQVVQHLNYVTYATYEGDEYVTQNIDLTNIVDNSVDTGTNTGIVADDVTADKGVINFGNGDVTNVPDADILDSAVSFGDGDAANASHNTLDDGSAIASGAAVEDDDTTITTVTTVNDNDVVAIQDNDTTVDDHHITQVQDNDTIVSGDDTALAVQ